MQLVDEDDIYTKCNVKITVIKTTVVNLNTLTYSFFIQSIGTLLKQVLYFTPFAVHYEKIRIHLRELTINSAKMHS